MDLYRYLKKEHKKINALFEEIILSNSAKNTANLFDELSTLLIIHAEAEQATFYKRLLEADQTKLLSQKAISEHKQVKKYLSEMSNLDVKDKRWLIMFGKLMQAVQTHVDEEEKLLFKEAKTMLTDEESAGIAEKFKQYMEEHL